MRPFRGDSSSSAQRVAAKGPLLLVTLAFVLAGCGGGPPSAESVARAWSEAVNTEDNDGAARLFADGARVVQGEATLRLDTFEEAQRWNTSLPCSGRIVRLTEREDTVRVTFVLGDRPSSKCDAPGERAQALFRVRDGKIVLWHQLDPALAPEEEPV